MDKVLELIAELVIIWSVNYFVVCLVGLCFGVIVTPLQTTGVLVALLWIRIVCGGGDK